MSWTLMTPSNGKRCRKQFNNHRDESDFYISGWQVTHKLPYDAVTIPKVPKLLKAMESGRYALFQTLTHAAVGEEISASEPNCPATPTNLLCLDFDCYASPCASSSSVRKRYDLIRRELPHLLSGVGAVVQLSAKAGLDWIWDKKQKQDVSPRLSIRIFLQADEAMTLPDWWKLLEPIARIREDSDFYDKSGYYFDAACFRSTQPMWLGIPKDNGTKRSDIDLTQTLLIEGELLNTESLRGYQTDTPSPSAKAGAGHQTNITTQRDARTQVWNLDYNVMLPALNDMDWDGKGIRNALLTEIFRRVAHSRVTDLEPTVTAILNCYQNLWNKDWHGNKETARKALTKRAEAAQTYVTRQYLGTDPQVRANNEWMVREIEGKDFDPALLEDLPDRVEMVITVDCGGGKSESQRVIRDEAWENGESVLYLAPFVINVKGVADGEKVTDYHSEGESAQNKQFYSNKKHPQQSWCWKSLTQIGEDNRKFDVVCLDECIEALRDYKKTPHFAECWEVLSEILRNARKIIWLDADFTDEFGLAMVSRLTANQDRKRYLIEGTESYAEGMNYYLFDSMYDAIWQAIESINHGQRTIINVDWANRDSFSKEWSGSLDAFADLIAHFCPDKIGKAFDSGSCPQELRESFGTYLNDTVEDGLDYLILSPLCPKGASYLPDDIANDFDVEVSILKARHSDAYKAYQTSRRCRRTAEHIVYLNSSTDPSADAAFWLQVKEKGFEHRALTTDEFCYTLMNIEEARRKSNPFDQLLVKLWNVNASVTLWSQDLVETKVETDEDTQIILKEPPHITNLSKVWAKLKKQHKALEETAQQTLIAALGSFLKPSTDDDGNPCYSFFEESDELPKAEINRLIKRYKTLKSWKFETMLETWLQTPQEREWWSEDNTARTKQWRVAIGLICDKLNDSIDASLDSKMAILQFVTDPEQTLLPIDVTNLDSTEVLGLINQYWRELKQAAIKPRAEAKNDIKAAITWLAKIVDCSVEKEPPQVKERYQKLLNEQQALKPGRYPKSQLFNRNVALLLEDIEIANATNTPLTQAQKEWWGTRKGVITIVKPNYVSTFVTEAIRKHLSPRVNPQFLEAVLGGVASFDNVTGEPIYDLL